MKGRYGRGSPPPPSFRIIASPPHVGTMFARSGAIAVDPAAGRHLSVFAAAVPFLELRIQLSEFLLGQICASLLRHEFLEFDE